jgi:photosystem II stability/assembly factor-like uncharacterized protein
MVDAERGWGQDMTTVFRTVDGGQTWTNVTPATLAAIPTTQRDIAVSLYRDASAAWIITENPDVSAPGRLFHTTDAGVSWTQTTLSGPLASSVGALSFVDPDHGWLMAGGAAMGSSTLLLDRTVDGGGNWDQLLHVPMYGAASGLVSAGDYSGMQFRDRLDGWITGTPVSLTGRPAAVRLFVTRDGGESWQPQPVPVPATLSSAQTTVSWPPLFFADGAGMLPVRFDSLQSGPFASATVFYRSVDGGHSWQPTDPVPVAPRTFLQYSFADPGHGWLAADGQLYRTTDGARTWVELHPNIGLNEVTELDFVTAGLGWALVVGPKDRLNHFFETTNGGSTWTEIRPRLSP